MLSDNLSAAERRERELALALLGFFH